MKRMEMSRRRLVASKGLAAARVGLVGLVGLVWCGLVWFGVVWCGLAWLMEASKGGGQQAQLASSGVQGADGTSILRDRGPRN